MVKCQQVSEQSGTLLTTRERVLETEAKQQERWSGRKVGGWGEVKSPDRDSSLEQEAPQRHPNSSEVIWSWFLQRLLWGFSWIPRHHSATSQNSVFQISLSTVVCVCVHGLCGVRVLCGMRVYMLWCACALWYVCVFCGMCMFCGMCLCSRFCVCVFCGIIHSVVCVSVCLSYIFVAVIKTSQSGTIYESWFFI